MEYLNFLHAVAEGIACGGTDVLRVLRFIFKLVDIAFFVVPMALILLISIDFAKNVMASKEDEMKKNVNIVIKRVIYCVVLFFVPTIVNAVISIVGDAGIEAVKIASKCIEIARDPSDSLLMYQIDYDNLDAINKNSCYVCKNNESIRFWSEEAPSAGTSGCSKFVLDGNSTSENLCLNKMFCWQCIDGSGYVWARTQPSENFFYNPQNSFGYDAGVAKCEPGFSSNFVDSKKCTTEFHGKNDNEMSTLN